MPESILLEACVDSTESALAAQEGGADRIELCSDLAVGGVTPSDGAIRLTRRQIRLPMHVLLRPRAGDFCYSSIELETMRLDIERMKQLGVDGVVLGILCPDGAVDRERTAVLADLARPLSITFHRAFDVCRDAEAALEVLIGLGIDRILTSGQERSVEAGIETIRRLVSLSAGRIVIMPGGGVSEHNIAHIIAHTGAKEIHASARLLVESRMEYRSTRVSMNADSLPPDFTLFFTGAERIRAMRSALEG